MAIPELTDSHSPPSSARMSRIVSMRAASCSLVIRGLATLKARSGGRSVISQC